jgi:hypothetical protein
MTIEVFDPQSELELRDGPTAKARRLGALKVVWG